MNDFTAKTPRLFTLLSGTFIIGSFMFFLIACGGPECQVCTKEGELDVHICEDDYDADILSALYLKDIEDYVARGYRCQFN